MWFSSGLPIILRCMCVFVDMYIINDASKQLVHEPCSGMMAIITYAAINVVSPLSFYIFQYTTTKPTDHQISDEKLLCSHFCEWPSHGNLDLVYLSLSRGTYLSPKMSFLNLWTLAFSTNFCPTKTDMSGNAVWPQASGFQKLAKIDHFCPLKK